MKTLTTALVLCLMFISSAPAFAGVYYEEEGLFFLPNLPDWGLPFSLVLFLLVLVLAIIKSSSEEAVKEHTDD